MREVIYYTDPDDERFGTNESIDHPDPSTAPRVLSKTEFQDHAVSNLGGGLTGMARFTAIMDATRDSTNGAVRFAWARYQAASSFEKDNTSMLTEIMDGDDTAGHVTSDERTAILANWPEA